ncbi:plasminogen receptor (KT) isoform X2 [Sus scrofa]|uniref:plasminogen receptor (KT) isoform X2 n=1 Tax=Sus scrofa TaxID=9823 RepID=UPI0003AEDA3D|nr:plasminogen receptor (KT) isoform X2 [Sus scrofa]
MWQVDLAPGSFTLAPYSSLIFCLGILVFLICILAGSSHGLCPSGKLERQLIMQNEMRERQMAMQIAWSREFLKYFGTFFGIASVALTAGAIKRKKPAFFLPIIPLGFVFTYQYDLGYGTLLQRMKGEAENILETETSKLQLPKGMITFEGLEKARREQSKFFIDK